MFSHSLVLLLLLVVGVRSSGLVLSSTDVPSWVTFSPSDFQSSVKLHDDVYLFWNVSSARVRMAVSAKTLGWVGVGLSWSGSMKGSDLWVLRETEGVFSIVDMWANGESFCPILKEREREKY